MDLNLRLPDFTTVGEYLSSAVRIGRRKRREKKVAVILTGLFHFFLF